MATLTVIPYKPLHSVIQKPFLKRVIPQPSSVKNVRFDFIDVPIEKLQSAGGTGGSNLKRKTAGDSKPTTHDVQASKDILARPQASVTEKYDSDDDTDDELPPLSDIFSGSYKQRQALREEERLLGRSIFDESNNGALHDNGSYKSRGFGSYGNHEPIVSDGGRSKDSDDDFDTEPAPRTLSSRQPSHDASNLGTPPILSNPRANGRDNDLVISKDLDDKSDTPSPKAAAVFASIDVGADPAVDLSKPVHIGHEEWWNVEENCFVDANLRPLLFEQDGLATSPTASFPHPLSQAQSEVHLKHLAASVSDEHRHTLRASRNPPALEPLPHSKDAQGSRENIDYSDLIESGEDEVWSKRRKLSAPLDDRTTPNPSKKRLRRPPSPISEDEEEKTLSTSVKSTSTSTTPSPYESAPPTELQLAVQAMADNQDWEVRKVIGKEDIDGVLHYLVDWSPTLAPKNSLRHAKELVDEFEARLLARREVKNGRGGSKRGERAVVEADASGSQQQKRRRGRPRKQSVRLALKS